MTNNANFSQWFTKVAVGAALLLATGIAALGQSRQVCGWVKLRDGETVIAGETVTAYAKKCGAGTITDNQGYFRLIVPDNFLGNRLSVEFSLIGYSTETVEVTLENGEPVYIEPVTLDIQPLMLTAAYKTRSGMPVADFILSQVWNRAEANRKVMSSYNADIRYSITTHEIPVVAQALSGVGRGAVKLAAGFTDYGPLVRYCLTHNDVSATVTMGRIVGYGTVKDFNKKIVSTNTKLPGEVVSTILSLPDKVDLFGMVYDRKNLWGESFAKTHTFNLIGTYEYGDKLVDVLFWTDRNKVISVTLHVVEEDWGILRAEVGREKEVVRFECRDVGNGIFMPVSLTMKPTMSLIRNSELPAVIKYINENQFVPKGIKKRSETVLTERYESGQDFNPYITLGFNINYANIRM